jgi:hypothetical protein
VPRSGKVIDNCPRDVVPLFSNGDDMSNFLCRVGLWRSGAFVLSIPPACAVESVESVVFDAPCVPVPDGDSLRVLGGFFVLVVSTAGVGCVR